MRSSLRQNFLVVPNKSVYLNNFPDPRFRKRRWTFFVFLDSETNMKIINIYTYQPGHAISTLEKGLQQGMEHSMNGCSAMRGKGISAVYCDGEGH